MLDFAGFRISDAAVAAAISRELGRQQSQIELIVSENIVSRDVLIAQGSVLTNKYAEGYPERALERAGLTCNKNAIPFDPEKPFVTSGVRLGTSAGTARGFGESEFARIGELTLKVVDALAAAGPEGDAAVEAAVLIEVGRLCAAHPIYGD